MRFSRFAQPYRIALLICWLSSGLLAAGAEFVVTNTNASGPGSLVEAILQANTGHGKATIAFAVPVNDPNYNAKEDTWTIHITAPLPPITCSALSIDATTQRALTRPGRPVTPVVVIVADKAGLDVCFSLVSASNVLRGVAISGFKYGIVLYGKNSTDNEVLENHIGVSPCGDEARANETGVILVEGASGNTVSRNVISGNTSLGVYIAGRDTTRNVLRGNRIGCDASGARAIPNTTGVMLSHCSETVIGGAGTTDRNIISGNSDIGVLLVGKWTSRNSIRGNFIGVDASGIRLLHNDKGIVIKSLANENVIGGKTEPERNVISGNLEIGIYIEAADGNRIAGNYIGTDATGQKAVQDGELVQGNGVEFNTVARNNILGGETPAERNVISGNKVYGVVYYGHCTQNATLGNYIGTDSAGRTALPNATGICVDCASHHNTICGNVISGNLSYGLFFVTRGTEFNVLRGNKIGTDAEGITAVPNDIGMVISTGASHNIVGGLSGAERNIISGNRQSGLMITNRFTTENQVLGNFIGVDSSGARPLPNNHGVIFSTYPKSNVLQRNVISGNRTVGLVLTEYAESNELIGNIIGADALGTKLLGNGKAELVLDNQARNNSIGKPGAGNLVAHEGPGGIVVQPGAGTGNTFVENKVRSSAQELTQGGAGPEGGQ